MNSSSPEPSLHLQTRQQFSFGGQEHQHVQHVHVDLQQSGACAADSTGLTTVWPASLALCEHLVAHPGLVRGCRRHRPLYVLELGCGAGLPGLLALALGAAGVTFSDREQPVSLAHTDRTLYLSIERGEQEEEEEEEECPRDSTVDGPDTILSPVHSRSPEFSYLSSPAPPQVLDRVQRSAALNGLATPGRAAARLYDWEQPRPLPGGWAGAWRLVVAADVVYATRTARALAAALRALLHPAQGVALVAHQERRAVCLDPATRLPRVEDSDEPWELFRASCRAEGLRERVLAQAPTTSPGDEGFMCILALAPSEAALEAAVGGGGGGGG